MCRNDILSDVQRVRYNSFSLSSIYLVVHWGFLAYIFVAVVVVEGSSLYKLTKRWNQISLLWLKSTQSTSVPLLSTLGSNHVTLPPIPCGYSTVMALLFSLHEAHHNVRAWQIPSSQERDWIELTQSPLCLLQGMFVATPLLSHSIWTVTVNPLLTLSYKLLIYVTICLF